MTTGGPVAGRVVAGAVLTGGRSTRMGRDKALVEVGGRPMARIAADALVAAGAVEVLAVGGDLDALATLGFDQVVPDDHPGEGPLGGLLTALRRSTADVVVVLACDLPDADAGAIATVVSALGRHDAAMPVTDRREPLHAAWDRSRCLPVLAAAFARGERAVHRAIAPLDVVEVHLADQRVLRSANQPRDLPG